ncbi:MAG TPA: PorV/PorQ family protein [Candidatus Kapabacteria bacterium]|nr:PorV/PorQ family protein [Candidatus Kapabacteria bacterium]
MYAQSFAAYAGEFLQLGAGARSLALGGSAIAFTNDATAGYWNPAALSELKYPSITGMHEARFDNTVKYDYGAVAIPIGRNSGAAFSVFHIGIDNIKDTRNAFIDVSGTGTFDGENYLDYSKVTTFGNYDWGFYFSYGTRHDSLLSYGATMKVIVRKLDPENSATGIGFDAAIKYQALPNLVLAAVGQDITTTLLAYTSGTRELVSPTIKIGGAYFYDIFSNGSHVLMPVTDIDLRFENRGVVSEAHLGPVSADIHLGLEYTFKNIISLRGGYTDTKQLTLGAGVHLPKLSIEYAFQSFNAQDQLGNIHRVSFAVSLEQEKWRRMQ